MADEMTQAAFARLMGVRRQTVHRWVRTGRIVLTRSGRVDPVAAESRLGATASSEAHHQENARRNAERRSGVRNDAERLEMLRATLELRAAKAELARMEVERVAAALVERTDVDAVLSEVRAVIRAQFEAMPGRLASEIAEHGDKMVAIHRTLEVAGREILTAISDHFEHLALTPATDGGAAHG